MKGDTYIDSYLNDPLALDGILKMYPDEKIVVVFNNVVEYSRFFSGDYFLALLEGLIGKRCFSQMNVLDAVNGRRRRNVDIECCLRSKNILTIAPPQKLVNPLTTDKAKLLKLFGWGVEAVDKIPEFLDRV